jgi:epoxyqueuosine reductase
VRISELRQEFLAGRISRRDFLRSATGLGLSLGVAQAMAACAPQPSSTSAPTLVPTQAPTATEAVPTLASHVLPTIPPEWLPTQAPTATTGPTVAPTLAPLYSRGATWSCPICTARFSSEKELMEHIASQHVRRIPGVHPVSEPVYAQFMVGDVQRFDQKNIVFGRVMWDAEYQELLSQVTPRPRRDTPEEVALGKALAAGAIYADMKAGSVHPQYRGFSGHLEGTSGLFSWDDSVSPEKFPVSDAGTMATEIKRVARFYGADLVGITRVNPLWVYSHRYDRETLTYKPLEMPLTYAIVMGIEMSWDEINASPGYGASAATALAYSKMPFVAAMVAKYIRTLGYPALPSGNDTTQSVPLAIDAGLGEWGRHGLLLTPEFGPRQRLCKVYTDLPLATDTPIEFGMVDFCTTCRLCAGACPSKAIPSGDRDTQPTSISNRPGFLRWYVDVAKCYLFWRANGIDCSNCVAACPWSFPKRPWI